MIMLQFSSTNGLLSRMIRFFTWSDVSHVDVVMPDGELLGAQWDGVKIRRPFYQKFTKVAKFSVEVSPEAEAKIMQFLIAQVGKSYDKGAIFGMPFRADWHKEDSWFCSELVAAAFEFGGYPLVNEQKFRITPRDLMISPRCLPRNRAASNLKSNF